ncbi:putative steroid-binding protein 3 [Diplodia seriata]|uniref:Putative steroid-binding protein 3 n=1 Tax=Diplodia seriata TaxID=420778 RepID=A0A1S8BAM6_9PEZI|nr:putative steroid-binding protein 3 [Diplodia seriata]
MDQKRDANHVEEPKRFEPRNPVQLDPPKDDPIALDHLAKCDGAIHLALFPWPACADGSVFDVSKNEAYGPKGQYKVFAGKEPNRALAQSSLKPEDCRPEWEDLSDKEKTVLDEWYTFFSKRYNIVGKVQRDATSSATL